MSFLKNLFRTKAEGPHKGGGNTQAVLVHLDGVGLPAAVYEQCDLATIEDQLTGVIERGRLGEFDGNEVGGGGATMYMYGPDAERLFSGIQATLRAYPLCQGAKIIVRKGGPGSPQREVKL
jgi:hypothetical protein